MLGHRPQRSVVGAATVLAALVHALCLLVSVGLGNGQTTNSSVCQPTASPSQGSAGSTINVYLNGNCSLVTSSSNTLQVAIFAGSNPTFVVPVTRRNSSLLSTTLPAAPFNGVVTLQLLSRGTGGNFTLNITTGFNFLPALNISSVEPASGQPGALVRLQGCFPPQCGDSLANISAVVFAGVVVAVQSSSSNLISFLVPNVTVTNQTSVAIRLESASQANVSVLWILAPAMQITSVMPQYGQTGTMVSIIGQYLFGLGGADGRQPLAAANVTVSLGGYAATLLVSNSSAQSLVVRLPQCPAPCNLSASVNATLRGAVTVTSLHGASAQVSNAFARLQDGRITSVSPAFGQYGTRVTINGTQLFAYSGGIRSVMFNNVTAFVNSNSSESIQVIVPRLSSSVNNMSVAISIETLYGAVISAASAFTALENGRILSVTPNIGQAGTYVSLTGTNLLGNGTNVTLVELGTANVTVLSANNTQINLQVLGGAIGNSTIRLQSNTGAIVENSQLIWALQPAGQILSISPPQGQTGTVVTINGTQLFAYSGGIRSVMFNNVTAFVNNNSSESIQVTMPRLSSSVNNMPVTISIETIYGAVISSASAFTALENGRILSVTPNIGQAGTYVSLTGTNLLGNGTNLTLVELGTANVTVLSVNNTRINLQVLGGAIGNSTIRLQSNTGAIVENSQLFWALQPAGQILSISPPQGQTGTVVTLQGNALTGYSGSVDSVVFGNVSATILSDASNTTFVQVRVEDHVDIATATPVEVVITSTSGAVLRAPVAWTYLTPGTIQSVEPLSGQVGTIVTITGVRLLSNGTRIASATLGNATAQVLHSNNSFVQLSIAGGTPGTGPVQLVSDTGAVVLHDNGTWSLLASGTISLVSPVSGQFGVRITVAGINLLGYGTRVKSMTADGVPVSDIVTNQSSSIQCRLGAFVTRNDTTPGSVLVRIEADTGAIVQRRLNFTYVAAQPITQVQPAQGGEGSLLVITGTSLYGIGGSAISSVRLGHGPPLVVLTTQPGVIAAKVGPQNLYSNTTTALNLTIVSNTGAVLTSSGVFRFNSSQIIAVLPSSGQNGTRVWINTSLPLLGDESVVIAQSPATVLQRTPVSILVAAGRPLKPGRVVGDVVVTSSLGQVMRLTNAFTYLEEPVIFNIVPRTGQRGTRVVVSGRNLIGNSTDTTVQSLQVGNALVDVSLASESMISGRLRATPSGRDVLVVLNTGASASLLNQWSSRAGNITSFSPAYGQTGTVVTIQGDLLRGDEQLGWVTLAGVNATVLWPSVNSSQIVVIAQSPRGVATDSGPIVITTTSGATVQSLSDWNFTVPAQITRVDPPTGQYGTLVTISGSNLLAAGQNITRVLLGNLSADILSYSDDQVTVRTPSNQYNLSSALLDVRVEANTGAFAVQTAAWSYLRASTLVSIVPGQGAAGTRVNITGTGLLLAGGAISQVTIGGGSAGVDQGGGGNTTVRTRANCSTTGSANVTVQTSNGALVTGLNFTCLPPGQVTLLTPTMGLPGTWVTVTGTNLFGYGQRLARIALNGIDVDISNITALDYSDQRLRFRAPPLPTVAVTTSQTLYIESDSGAFVSSTNNPSVMWHYANDTQIDTVEPHIASPGDTVVLTGSNLLLNAPDLSTVQIGGVPVLEVISASSSRVMVRLGASTLSSPLVLVASNGGEFVESGANFTVASSSATGTSRQCQIVSVSPPAGQSLTRVTLAMMNFSSAVPQVWLDGQKASVTSSNATHITVRATLSTNSSSSSSSNTPGFVQVYATSGNDTWVCGRAAAWQSYPALFSVSPQSGREGTRVAITNPSLFAALTARGIRPVQVSLAGNVQSLGTFTPTPVTLIWSTVPFLTQQIAFQAAASNSTNFNGTVRVDFSDTSSVEGELWTYVTGTIASIVPPSGSNGVHVAIRGTNLIGGGNLSRVWFGNTSATILSSSESLIEVRVYDNSPVPGGQAGPVTIESTTGAVLRGSAQQQWTLTRLAISTVQPTSGQAGTRIVITGQFNDPALLNASIEIGGLRAQLGAVHNTSYMTAVIPTGVPTNTSATVRILWSDGSSVLSRSAAFTYLTPGGITDVAPSTAALGTRVLLSGTGLLGGGTYASMVCLSGIPAQQVTLSTNNAVQIIAGDAANTNNVSLTRCDSDDDLFIRANTGAEVQLANTSTRTVTYAPPPQLSISPLAGQNGTRLDITSSQPWPALVSSVSVAGIPARVVSVEPSSVQAVLTASPYHTPVAGGLSVRLFSTQQPGLPGQVIVSNVSFVAMPTGQITSVQPASGQRGTLVIVTGRSLFGDGSRIVSARLGTHEWTVQTSSDQMVRMRLTSIALSSQGPALASVRLTSNTGSVVQLSDAFTYLQPGILSSVEPRLGRWGTQLTLLGQRLLGGAEGLTRVTVGGNIVRTFVSSTNSSITFHLPPSATVSTGVAQNVTIVIESTTGALTSIDDSFELLPPGNISSISPRNGTSNTRLCVYGSNLLGGGTSITSAWIAGIPVAGVISSNDTQACLLSGRNTNGSAIPAATVLLQANTGAYSEAVGIWAYDNECSISQFYNSSAAACEECSPVCNQCNGTGPTNCKDCAGEGYFRLLAGAVRECIVSCATFLQGKQCVGSCNSTHEYAQVNMTSNTTSCQPCHAQCVGCTGPGNADCMHCRNVDSSGVCLERCPAQTYPNTNSGLCLPCNAQCVNCSGPTAFECFGCRNYSLNGARYFFGMQPNVSVEVETCVPSCNSTTRFVNKKGQCERCHEQCNGCTGPSATECIECLYKSLPSTECVPSCPSATYSDEMDVCRPCSATCASCDRSSVVLGDGCFECTNTSLMQLGVNESLSCIGGSKCQYGYYQNVTTLICIACPTSCANSCEEYAPTCLSSTDLFAYGIGTLGVAVGVAAVLLLLLLLMCLLLARSRRRQKSPTSYEINDEKSSVIPLTETELNNHAADPVGTINGTGTDYCLAQPRANTSFSSESSAQYQPPTTTSATVLGNAVAAGGLNPADEEEEYLTMEGGEETADFYMPIDTAQGGLETIRSNQTSTTMVSGAPSETNAAAAASAAAMTAAAMTAADADDGSGDLYEDMVPNARHSYTPAQLPTEAEPITDDVYEPMAAGLQPAGTIQPEVVPQPQNIQSRPARSKSQTPMDIPPPAAAPVNVVPLPARGNRPVSMASIPDTPSPTQTMPPAHVGAAAAAHQSMSRSKTSTLPQLTRDSRDSLPGLPLRDRGRTADPPAPSNMVPSMSTGYLPPPAQRLPAQVPPANAAVSPQRSLPHLPGDDVRPGRSGSKPPPPPTSPPPPLETITHPALPPRNPGMSRNAADDDIYEVAHDDYEVV